MVQKRLFCVCAVLAVFFSSPSPGHSAPSLELYGTFHAMGVIVTIDTAGDSDQDATAEVAYRSGTQAFRKGFPLSRVADTRFVGSLFWLKPGTAYDVRVTLSDPDGAPLDGTQLSDTASTRPEIRIPEPEKTYYVSPEGSGDTCTMASPCRLTSGIAQAQAGEAVVLRGGVYQTGDMSLPRSGTADHPVQIRGYSGETPILDGADPDSNAFSWSAYQQKGVYMTTVHEAGTHYVMADGVRLFPYDDLTDLEDLSRDDMPGFYTSGTTLYVHLTGDRDPGTANMVISRYNNCFYVEQAHIYFLNLTFRYYGQGDWAKVIYLNNADDNLIQGCVFTNNDLGIGVKRNSNRNVIQKNVFSDVIFHWSWDHIKDVGGLEDGGITFYDPVDGRGNIIRRNTFHHDFDGFNACPVSSAAMTNETDVYENLVYNMGDDGMEADGRCSNVRIWGNVFHDVLMGISLAPATIGPTYAIRNLIYRTGVGNNTYSGSPFKFNSGYGPSGPMYLFHNTADAVLPGNNGLYVKSPGTWQQIYARNNIWAGTAFAMENYNTGQPINLDCDNLYNGGSGDLVRWDGTRYATLSAFISATGQEPCGLSVDPGFRHPARGNYRLTRGSALIDAGQIINGINCNYRGAAPDVGAYETSPPIEGVKYLLLGD